MLQPEAKNKELRPSAANKRSKQAQAATVEPVECKCGMVYTPTKEQPRCPQCYRRPEKDVW